MIDINKIELYRITHIDNIPHILKYGITHKNSKNSNPNYINIGDSSIISRRQTMQININGKIINLCDFIPFYFGVKMPMLYVIQKGGNFVPQKISPDQIVYLVCKLIDLINLGNDYYFSDGHAVDNLTKFYDKSSINNLPSILDWKAISAGYWGSRDGNLDIKRKKQAEFLIKGDLPTSVIKKLICYNKYAFNKLKTICPNITILQKSNYYF
jgi:hypothetical protein